MQVESYSIKSEGIDLKVSIEQVKDEGRKYILKIPEIGVATRALLEQVKRKLITDVAITTGEILNPEEAEKTKEKFKSKAEILIKESLPNVEDDSKKFLIAILMHEMVGLGDVEFLLNDINLEEIILTSANEAIRVYHRKYGWLKTNLTPKSEAEIQNIANIIARRVGRQITILTPLLDAHLITGDRANAVLYPISTKGNTITIRKFTRDPWTIVDLIKNKTCPPDVYALIWLGMQYEASIMISGGTASGKTTLLSTIMPFIPPNHRIISIEQTRELMLPEYLYWCPLVTRLPNPEGKGSVDMLDLLVNSLRMRPDRIVVGEIRRKEEAQVLFEAMHTGHSVYSTVHADSMDETIKRLTNPPIRVPSNLLGAVNLNVVMFRDRKRALRRVFQVGEFVVTEESFGSIVKPNVMYRWKPETDSIVPHLKSVKFFEDLSRHTGMTEAEINKDLAEKKRILDLMAKKNIRSLEEVGKLMNQYYLEPELVMKKLRK